MRVLHVASEAYPLEKTGGLADVTAALPLAQGELGIWVTSGHFCFAPIATAERTSKWGNADCGPV